MDDDVDHISGLPDELLHIILVRLCSLAAAARTSILSRRWRRVWAHMPSLDVGGIDAGAPARTLDSVDGVLAGYAAPTVNKLRITMPLIFDGDLPAHRVAAWLRFASQRVAGELDIFLPQASSAAERAKQAEEKEVVELPLCERATRMTLSFGQRFRLRPIGPFSELTDLKIYCAPIDAGDLGTLVSSSLCPRLRNLCLRTTLVAASDVYIRSDTLRSLEFYVGETRRLDVAAPRLEKLSVSDFYFAEAHIAAPKLAKFTWSGEADKGNDELRHQLVIDDAGRHLRRLEISGHGSTGGHLLRRFDSVNVLKLEVSDPYEEEYDRFMENTDRFPRCKTLEVISWHRTNEHAMVPRLMHLLGRCSGMRRLLVFFYWHCISESNSCPLACSCPLPQMHKSDGIALDSLEDIVIVFFTGECEQVEFLSQLFRLNASMLKRVVIMPSLSHKGNLGKELCEKVRRICPPSIKVEFKKFF